ncbi:MAG TPA: respiratory nitrate reductase subunit gamma [Desulfomonilaceae bacterium]|nr:respiratory nitrate reductase subunit gamma [Desulfomonilaceae bacterium]
MPFAGLERVKSPFPGFQIKKNRAAHPDESSAVIVSTILPRLRPLRPIALTVFVVGHSYRYITDLFDWNSKSSELPDKEILRFGITL